MRFTPIPSDLALNYQSGGADAYGLPPEQCVSNGEGNPCRHCLRDIPAGAGMLILAHRPFPALQPYAETGPVFLCADACPAGGGDGLPDILSSPEYMLRGYSAHDRIAYGSGAVVPTARLIEEAASRLQDQTIAYLHVRSARNNCYQLRIDRA